MLHDPVEVQQRPLRIVHEQVGVAEHAVERHPIVGRRGLGEARLEHRQGLLRPPLLHGLRGALEHLLDTLGARSRGRAEQREGEQGGFQQSAHQRRFDLRAARLEPAAGRAWVRRSRVAPADQLRLRVYSEITSPAFGLTNSRPDTSTTGNR